MLPHPRAVHQDIGGFGSGAARRWRVCGDATYARDVVSTSALPSPARTRPRRRLPAWLRERPIAHRGLHDGERPENSLEAFEAAVVAEHPIELDVRRLRDGHVVVFHDAELERMTGRPGAVEHQTKGDLASVRLQGTRAPIPLLEEVLELVAGRVPLVIEIKNEGRVGAPEHALERALREYDGPVALQSFNPLTLAWFREHAPHHPRGQLASDFEDAELAGYERFLLRRLLLAPLSRPDYVGYELRCLPYWAPSLARRLGLPLIAWTVRSQEDLALASRRADNYIFESIRPPSRLQKNA
jgi:glycerophosphoryl diester phosphodiesterase